MIKCIMATRKGDLEQAKQKWEENEELQRQFPSDCFLYIRHSQQKKIDGLRIRYKGEKYACTLRVDLACDTVDILSYLPDKYYFLIAL